MTGIYPYCFVMVVFAASSSLFSQTQISAALPEQSCGYAKRVLDPLVEEADRGQFNTRRVEIAGSTYTRDRKFRKRMAPGMNEGDIFTQGSLQKTVRSIARMKVIYPITMDNIEVRLNRPERIIDVVICVTQKPRLL
jgi:hypothetical protein